MVKRGVKKGSRQRYLKILSKSPPLSVKIVSVFFYVNAILYIILGIASLLTGILGASFYTGEDMQKILNTYPGISTWGIEIGVGIFSLIILFAVFILIVGIIEYYIGRGLWKGRRLAFILASLLIILGFLISLGLVISLNYSALFGLIIYAVLLYCLFIDKGARKYFDLGYFFKKSR